MKRIWPEAATRGVLCEKMFLEISQNLQGNICFRVSFSRPATLLKKILWHRCFCEFCEISKNTLFYITPLDDCFCGANWNDYDYYDLRCGGGGVSIFFNYVISGWPLNHQLYCDMKLLGEVCESFKVGIHTLILVSVLSQLRTLIIPAYSMFDCNSKTQTLRMI